MEKRLNSIRIDVNIIVLLHYQVSDTNNYNNNYLQLLMQITNCGGIIISHFHYYKSFLRESLNKIISKGDIFKLKLSLFMMY